MAAPLSQDLRQRIWQIYQKDKPSNVSLARRFCVSEGVVRKIIKQGKETGDVTTYKPGPKGPHKFKQLHRDAVKQWLDETPDLFLHEIQAKLQDTYQLDITIAHLSIQLDAMGLPRKKKSR